jgi:hypothetical protein
MSQKKGVLQEHSSSEEFQKNDGKGTKLTNTQS